MVYPPYYSPMKFISKGQITISLSIRHRFGLQRTKAAETDRERTGR